MVSLSLATLVFLSWPTPGRSIVVDNVPIKLASRDIEKANAHIGIWPAIGFHPLGFRVADLRRAQYQNDRF